MPWRLLALIVPLMLACAPAHRYAASDVPSVRFELSTVRNPEGVAAWYRCFEVEDPDYRKVCLAKVSAVRVSRGGSVACAEPADPATLCRVFPVHAPRFEDATPSEDEREAEDDGLAGAIVEAVFEGLFEMLAAAITSDESDDQSDDQDESADSGSSSRSRKSSQRRMDERPAQRKRQHRRK